MDVEQLYNEESDDRLINDAFQKLLNDYLASRHRKSRSHHQSLQLCKTST